jgi:hypothetical protein
MGCKNRTAQVKLFASPILNVPRQQLSIRTAGAENGFIWPSSSVGL